MITAGFSTHLISSVALARMREALHSGWDKNDPKDAKVILHMLAAGQVQRYHDPLAQEIADWQELFKMHEAISKNKTEMLHRLKAHYLPLYFPGVDRFRNNSRSEWFFRFLHEFPTPGTITALSKEVFIAASSDLLGRKVSKRRVLADIYDTACTSSGLPVANDSAAVAMNRPVIMQMRQLIRHRDTIEAEALRRMEALATSCAFGRSPALGPFTQ